MSGVAPDDFIRLQDKLTRAVALIRRLEAERDRRPAPEQAIAVIGMACRFPGGPNLESFAALLAEGRDGVSEIPPERFDAHALLGPSDQPGALTSSAAGIIEGIDLFDSAFFGLTPREADALDPQHRLLLELSHEALERAGLAPSRLAGAKVGVHLGLSNSDYAQLRLRCGDLAAIQAYDFTGTILATAAGAISYAFDFTGPCTVVDTACSSSLVALHQAVVGLRSGAADLALAGGSNLILTPEMSVALSRLGALSPSGRCRTFDAEADGYVRSEGCGLVVLKRLDEAERDGNPVLAVIRGLGLNHDGRSNGMFAPNGAAQRQVLRAALAEAGLGPEDIACLEAHGTGTRLGDPVEVDAVRAIFGETGPPLPLTAVKSAIGHLEAAAGIAGLIALILTLRRGITPVNPLFQRANPHISWGERLVPASRPTALTPNRAGRLFGGVSSFGISGTNVHVVVEVLTPAPPAAAEPAEETLYLLTAGSEAGLAQAARQHAAALRDPGLSWNDAAWTSLTGRDRGSWRLALSAGNGPAAAEALENWAEHRTIAPGLAVGRGRSTPGVAFLFSGQGSHCAGMGRTLYHAEPVFRAVIDRADAALRAVNGVSLIDDLLMPPPGAPDRLSDTRQAQPALFAIGLALAALWRSWGVVPAAVIGHSLGEYIAAAVAGVFDLEDGVRLVAARAQAMAEAPGQGAMMACLAPRAAVEAVVAAVGAGLEIAAFNSPRSLTLTGAPAVLAEAATRLHADGFRTAPLPVSHAFHSALMEPAAATLREVLRGINLTPPTLPILSNLTGEWIGEELCQPDYWAAQLRRPVRFAEGIATLARQGLPLWIEIGARPVLSAPARESLGDDPTAPQVRPSLRPGWGERSSMLATLADWTALGGEPDPRALARGAARRNVPIPTYPFERRRHWLPAPPAVTRPTAAALPGVRLDLPDGSVLFKALLSAQSPAWAADHRVFGTVLFPGAGFLDLVLRAGCEALGVVPWVREARILRPLRLDLPRPAELQTRIIRAPGEWCRVTLQSRSEDGRFETHAEARLSLAPPPAVAPVPVPAAGETEAAAAFLARAKAIGITYGPAFQGLGSVTLAPDLEGARGTVRTRPEMSEPGALLPPAWLDCCVQVAGAALTRSRPGIAFVPVAVETLVWLHPPAAETLVTVALSPGPGQSVTADLDATDPEGQLVFCLRGLRLEAVTAGTVQAALPGRWRDWLCQVTWRRSEEQRPAVRLSLAEVAAGLTLPAPPELIAARQRIAPLEASCLHWIERSLHVLIPAEGGTLAALSDAVVPAQAALFRRLLTLASASGLLELGGDGTVIWRRRRRLAEIEQDLAAADPTTMDQAKAALVAQCGAQLTAVLRGEAHPVEVLFPAGEDHLVRAVYAGSPLFVAMQQAAGQLVKALLRPEELRRLRVLEVGAGTGSTTAAVLPGLAPFCQEYLFTDVSRLLLERARERFAAYPCLCTGLFDAERDGPDQGLDPAGFDLILAANVVHATTDLVATLGRLRRLLAPGGRLVLVEGIEPWRWADLTFGLTEGWWRFRDHDLRPAHPLLSEAQWPPALAAAGFASAVTLAPRDADGHSLTGQVLVVAGLDSEEAVSRGTVAVLGDGGLSRATQRAFAIAGWQVSGETAEADLVIDPRPAEADVSPETALAGALALLQARAGAGRTRDGLCFVTRGAWAIEDSGNEDGARKAGLWGVVRAANREQPELQARCLDLPSEGEPETLAGWILAHAGSGRDLELIRAGFRLHPILSAVPSLPLPLPPGRLGQGTVLLTGAFGGLGCLLLRWLAERGVRRILAIARRPAEGAAATALAAARALGTEVETEIGDLTDPSVVTRAVERADRADAPLIGLIHAAGRVEDAILAAQSPATLAAAMRPKAEAAWALHHAVGDRPLAFFLLFSSATSLLAVASQANHAAANVSLDALALYRRSRGLTASAIDWGPWAETGAATRSGLERRIGAMGVGALRPEEGLAMTAALTQGAEAPGWLGVLPVDWPSFTARYGEDPLLATLANRGEHPPESRPARPVAAELGPRLAALPATERSGRTTELLTDLVCGLLGRSAEDAPSPEQGLFEAGLDSLTAMELRNALARMLGKPLPATLVFTAPTVAALARLVLAELGLEPMETLPPPPVVPPVAAETVPDEAAALALIEQEMARLGLNG